MRTPSGDQNAWKTSYSAGVSRTGSPPSAETTKRLLNWSRTPAPSRRQVKSMIRRPVGSSRLPMMKRSSPLWPTSKHLPAVRRPLGSTDVTGELRQLPRIAAPERHHPGLCFSRPGREEEELPPIRRKARPAVAGGHGRQLCGRCAVEAHAPEVLAVGPIDDDAPAEDDARSVGRDCHFLDHRLFQQIGRLKGRRVSRRGPHTHLHNGCGNGNRSGQSIVYGIVIHRGGPTTGGGKFVERARQGDAAATILVRRYQALPFGRPT